MMYPIYIYIVVVVTSMYSVISFISDIVINKYPFFKRVYYNDEYMLCTLCQCVVNDSVEHVLLRCEGLLDERCRMWDDILDALDVHIEAKLLNLEDHDILYMAYTNIGSN